MIDRNEQQTALVERLFSSFYQQFGIDKVSNKGTGHEEFINCLVSDDSQLIDHFSFTVGHCD
jgi:hypothetical protein